MRRALLVGFLVLGVGCGRAPTSGGPDGGIASNDAGHVDLDAGHVEPDAGQVEPDAGQVDPDAGQVEPDAGQVDPDAGQVDPDAGQVDPDAGWIDPDAGPPEPDGGSTLWLRIATGNLSSGNLQSYDPGEGIRIFEGLHPDVALIQEFNYGTDSPADLRTMIDQAFGTDYAYVRGASGQQIPNGIASRFPIVASGEWTDPRVSNRDFVWARIALPGGHELFAVSVHLLTSSSGDRAAEASALVSDLRAQVPAGDLLALGGDFNTSTRTESCVSTFGALFATQGPYPADQQGNENTNASRAKPYDWVLVDPALDADRAPLQLGGSAFTDGLVFDSRVYAPLSDVSPVQSGDSAASNMQHMAVVREFALSN